MRISDKAIVLQAIRYGDRKYILKLYTRDHGLLSVSAVTGSSAKSKLKPAMILPLSLLEIELIMKQNKEVQQLNEASCYYISENIPGNMAKLGIAQFVNEIIIKTCKEHSANHSLFDFIESFLKYLNECDDGYNNLHIYFLMEMCRYLGIEPNNNYSQSESYFDVREGKFSSMQLPFPLGLDKPASSLLSKTIEADLTKIKLSKEERNQLLEILLAYFQMHIPGFSTPKSHTVLKEVSNA
ncbi:MAG TPA: DNA repair protein RecO [Bacteroidia bacterium]|nr:DNA repair protein RecO [Bacteroidia bacterium]